MSADPVRELSTTRPGSRIRAAARRFATIYKGAALLLLNMLVVFVLLNVVIALGFWARGAWRAKSLRAVDPITAKYDPAVLDKVYPDFTRQERGVMLTESWTRPYLYDDFTHFRERPIDGKYVNVTKEGYRKSADQGPWPPSPENINVFFFGGSTTFGYGVPDDQTIPSHFQKALAGHAKRRVCVYNFAVGWFFSTQEQILFEKMLCDGIIPHVAIFIDGMNDASHVENKPAFSPSLAASFEQSSSAGALFQLCFRRMPVGLLAEAITRKARPAPVSNVPGLSKERVLDRMCDRYFINKFSIEQLCNRFGVTPVFVWQPAPGHHYDMKYHPFAPPGAFADQTDLYGALHARVKGRPVEPNFLWCADLQQGHTEPLYCDYNHYTGAFSKVLAEYVCQLCVDRKLLDEDLNR